MENSSNYESPGSGMDEYSPFISCAAQSMEVAMENKTDIPVAADIAIRVFQTLFGFTIVIFGCPLNFLFLYLVYKFKALRTVSFGIACQVAVANLIMSLIYGIPTIMKYISGNWDLGTASCVTAGFFYYTLSNVRTLLIFIFSLDRFLMVFAPFSYPKHSLKVVVLMSVIAWSLCISVHFSLVLSNCFFYSAETLICAINTSCYFVCGYIFYIFLSCVTIPAILLTMGFFLALFVKGKCIRRQERNLGGDEEILAKQEWKAIKSFAILFLGAFVVTVPAYLLLYVADFLGPVWPTVLKVVASNTIAFGVITDLAVLMRNADVREVLKTLRKSVVTYWRNSFQRRSANISGANERRGIDVVAMTAANFSCANESYDEGRDVAVNAANISGANESRDVAMDVVTAPPSE